MKIFIELPTWLGDAVMSTLAIENITLNFPNAKITFFGSFASTSLFTNHPILAMFGGAITTALIQSSSAMIAIVQQMYHLKALSLYVSIPSI